MRHEFTDQNKNVKRLPKAERSKGSEINPEAVPEQEKPSKVQWEMTIFVGPPRLSCRRRPVLMSRR